MAIWIMPFIVATAMIVWISVASIQKSSKLKSLSGAPDEIPDMVEEHPFVLNPIIWVILIATFFIGIVIAYYAFTTSFI